MEEETKTKKHYWQVDCLVCETHVYLAAHDYGIVSTAQGAEFIRKPTFICGKCGSVSTVELGEGAA